MAKSSPPLPHIDGPEEFKSAFAVSRETIVKLETYAALLRQWQKAVNLVGPATLGDVWHRHFADSAQLGPLIPSEARALVDLGSGAGFPGLVLAILLAERGPAGPRVTLVEADSRRVAFLREVSRQTGTPVDILGARIENVATQVRLATVDVVTARALAPLPRLLSLSLPLFGPHTIGLFLKGREAESEIAEAQRQFAFDASSTTSRTHPEGRMIEVRRLRVNDQSAATAPAS
jgi:16S rRNA (guanine527-N7)-methyltransferase